MTKQSLIERTIDNLAKLPEQKIKEVSDFTEFLLSKLDDQVITKGIQHLVADNKSFDFLKDEEDLYDEEDLKERYK
ncbi:hypothetical protein AAE02nite_03060 [Adhaeribacter aerolatus]|uniref:DUF2281 domain-containing protein n=1 Tax=Adhaeribacter aerolatus TaxID=670289 RepID=A0A512ASG0_9BACT|nr:hypothetical protein [Adhaeribacter aerolatus]GEO02642.1 hypothetical protein AAE02nite_03060 [Adhaeribacter aerolatus]